MEKQTYEDTLQCITDHYEEKLGKSTTEYNDLVNSYNDLIDKNEELFLKCSELVTEKNEKQRRIKRKAHYFLNENEKDITFVKQFPNGWLKLIRMVKEEKITYFDLGMFASLGAFLDQDTGIIMDMEGKALDKSGISKLLNKKKQNFNRDFKNLIDNRLLIQDNKGNFMLNNLYLYNGKNRINAEFAN